MNRLGILGDFVRNVIIFLAQVLILKNLVLFEAAFCFAYVIIYLQFSMFTSPLLQMIFAFFIGLSVDIFYNTPGMHAAASVLMIFCRIYWIRLLTPRGGYDTSAKVNIRTQGLQWFLGYTYPLILIHSITLFFIEAGGGKGFWTVLGQGIYSSLFTLSIVLIVQYLAFKKIK